MSFPKKAFVFPNNRISEARICRQCWLKKISRKRKIKQQKKLRGNVFPLSLRTLAKIELIWTRKKNSTLKVTYVVVARSPSTVSEASGSNVKFLTKLDARLAQRQKGKFIKMANISTNKISQNIGHFNKLAILPLCQPCFQFCLLHYQ